MPMPGRGAAHHREHRGSGNAVGKRLLELLEADGVAFEVALHELVVGHHDPLDEGVVDLVLGRCEVVGDGALDGAPRVVGEGPVGEQVEHAPEAGLLAHRQLEWCDPAAERVLELGQRPVEVGPFAVELVDEQHAGDAPGGRDLPGQLGLDLEALDRAHDEHGEVGDAQRGLDLTEEVGVAGTVQQVDLVVLPGERRQGQGRREAVLDLLRLRVAHGTAVLDPAHARDRAGAVQEGLGERRLPRSSVAHEGDVADSGRGCGCHAASMWSSDPDPRGPGVVPAYRRPLVAWNVSPPEVPGTGLEE